MSAPSTNIEKQKSRHSGVLRWMAIATGAVAVMFVVFYSMVTSDDDAGATGTAPVAVEQDS